MAPRKPEGLALPECDGQCDIKGQQELGPCHGCPCAKDLTVVTESPQVLYEEVAGAPHVQRGSSERKPGTSPLSQGETGAALPRDSVEVDTDGGHKDEEGGAHGPPAPQGSRQAGAAERNVGDAAALAVGGPSGWAGGPQGLAGLWPLPQEGDPEPRPLLLRAGRRPPEQPASARTPALPSSSGPGPTQAGSELGWGRPWAG